MNPLGDRPLLLTLLSGLFTALGCFLVGRPDSFWAGLSCLVFFGGCTLVGIGALVDESRAKAAARNEHVPPRSITPVLMVLASLALGLGCGLMALLVATGLMEPDRRYGLGIIPVGAIGFVFFLGGGMLLLVRLLRGGDR